MDYFRSDSSLVLPKSCQDELDKLDKINKNDSDLEDDDSWKDQDEDENNYVDFPEFDSEIRKALDKFNNKVFVKLNWSSPKDAIWALNKLSCNKLSDVYILLKSSDFINHDLNEPFSDCDDKPKNLDNLKYYLIIREWININPNMEFRCFVYKNKLVGNLKFFYAFNRVPFLFKQ